MSYWYKNIGNSLQEQLKTTFFKLDKKTDLIVAAGAYHPDMEAIIAGYHGKLREEVTRDVRNIILVLLLIFSILLLIVRFMSNKISHEFTVFTNFFSKAVQENKQIDNNSLSLKEFEELATTVNQMIGKRQLVEQSFHDSEEKFRALAFNSPTAIFIHQQGTLVYGNPAAVEISGYPLDELLQMNSWELVHPDMREQVKNFGQQREAGADIPQRYEMKIITKQGEIKWLDFNAATIDFEGKPAIMDNVIDMTDRKNSERDLLTEKERLAVTLSSIGNGVMVTDLRGKITLMNHSAEQR